MTTDTHAILSAYLAAVSEAYASGKATEHSYRPAIKALIEGLVPGIVATNEPKRIACGAPDVILAKDGVPVGFVKTKVPFDDDLEGRAAFTSSSPTPSRPRTRTSRRSSPTGSRRRPRPPTA